MFGEFISSTTKVYPFLPEGTLTWKVMEGDLIFCVDFRSLCELFLQLMTAQEGMIQSFFPLQRLRN